MKKKDFVLVLVFFAVLSTKCLLLYNDEERKKERKKEREDYTCRFTFRVLEWT